MPHGLQVNQMPSVSGVERDVEIRQWGKIAHRAEKQEQYEHSNKPKEHFRSQPKSAHSNLTHFFSTESVVWGVLEGKSYFLKILFIFRERVREGEREGEKHQCVVASRVPCNPGMCPAWELNQQPFGSQDCIQSTELYQPGQVNHTLKSLRFGSKMYIYKDRYIQLHKNYQQLKTIG